MHELSIERRDDAGMDLCARLQALATDGGLPAAAGG
jgi:hypothetical protein